MRDLTELGLNEGGEPVTAPPPTAAQIALVEQLLGVPLPAAYIQFLTFSNGGCPEPNLFELKLEGGGTMASINNFFRLASDSLDTNDTEDVVWNYQHTWPGGWRELLPIGRDGGDNRICLDLSPVGGGRVLFHVHDSPGWPLLGVAASFEEFIDSLTFDPDAI